MFPPSFAGVGAMRFHMLPQNARCESLTAPVKVFYVPVTFYQRKLVIYNTAGHLLYNLSSESGFSAENMKGTFISKTKAL